MHSCVCTAVVIIVRSVCTCPVCDPFLWMPGLSHKFWPCSKVAIDNWPNSLPDMLSRSSRFKCLLVLVLVLLLRPPPPQLVLLLPLDRLAPLLVDRPHPRQQQQHLRPTMSRACATRPRRPSFIDNNYRYTLNASWPRDPIADANNPEPNQYGPNQPPCKQYDHQYQFRYLYHQPKPDPLPTLYCHHRWNQRMIIMTTMTTTTAA